MADREKYQDYEGAWGSRVPEAEVGSFENEGTWGTHLRWSRAGEHAAKEPESETQAEEPPAEQDTDTER
jgi:hypothetical protein